MPAPTDVLDAAYDRLAQWGFDEPDAYVNHGPMVCEALDTLGRPEEVDRWSRLDNGSPPVHPVDPGDDFVWQEALGDPTRTPEWMGFFARAVEDEGWEDALRRWLPRLLPGMSAALFHGAIRCAHATRALATADTPARRAELVRSLGYWAALCAPSDEPATAALTGVDDVGDAIIRAAASAARCYLARSNILNLHGVTAAMAVSLLVQHTDEEAAAAALAQLNAEHDALFERTRPVEDVSAPALDAATLVDAAIASGEAHAVKLVEACLRGLEASGDEAFLAAAERVVRRGLRVLHAGR